MCCSYSEPITRKQRFLIAHMLASTVRHRHSAALRLLFANFFIHPLLVFVGISMHQEYVLSLAHGPRICPCLSIRCNER